MGWQDRLTSLVCAGGALVAAATGCTPCGNANPDPCICGRIDDTEFAKQRCEAKKACEANGGHWDPYVTTDAGRACEYPTSDGGTADSMTDASEALDAVVTDAPTD
jgi:hypothetical protein